MRNTKLNKTKNYLKSKNIFTESEIKILAKELQYISEEQLNEWSLKDLKDKAKQILAKTKEKTSELVDKAKSGELTQDVAKKIKGAKDSTIDAINDLKAKAKEHGLDDKAASFLSKVKDAATSTAKTAAKAGSKALSVAGKAAKKVGNITKDKVSKITGIKPETLDKLVDKSGKIAFSVLYSTLNGSSGGNISDQVIEFYMNKVGNNLSEDELKKTISDLGTKFPKLQKQIEKDEKAQGKEDAEAAADAAESSEIDESTCKFYAMFNDETGKALRKAVIEFDKQSVGLMDGLKTFEQKVPNDLDKLVGDTISKEDKKKYGVLIAMLSAKGLKGEELKREFEKMKKTANESVKTYCKKQNLLKENKMLLTKKQKQKLFERTLAANIITEAWNLNVLFGGANGCDIGVLEFVGKYFKGTGLKWTDVVSASEELYSKIDVNGDGFEKFKSAVTNEETRPALGFNLDIVGPLAVMGMGSLLYKYRKPLANGIGRGLQHLKNKKGVIAAMQFSTKDVAEADGDDRNVYKLQFSVTDFVWRVINTKNSKKLVKEEIVKSALDSEIGKKFRKRCQELWAPLFGVPDNNKIPVFYKTIDVYAKALGLSKSDVKAIQDFGDNFKKIAETCLGDNYKYDIRNK